MPAICKTVDGIDYGPMSMLNHKLDVDVYDKYARPNTQLSPSTGVGTDADHLQIMLELKSVQKIDPILQTVTISVKAYTQWFDDRLAYNISSEDPCIIGSLSPGGRTRALLEPKDYKAGSGKRVWTPEPYVVNKVDEFVSKELVYVYQTGLVSLFEVKTIKFACDMDFAKFPFDKQTCFIKYRDFAHAASEIVLNPGIERFGYSDLIIFSTSVQKSAGTFHVIKKTMTEDKVVDNIQTIYGYLYFERSQSTFWAGTFLVDFLLNIAVWVSFWIPKQVAPARIALIIISFLAFRIVMSSLYAQLPPVTYSVWVIDYMGYSQFFAALALMQYGYLCFYIHKEKALEQFLKTVSQSNLEKFLDEDGWDMADLAEECARIKADVNELVEREKKGGASSSSSSSSSSSAAAAAGAEANVDEDLRAKKSRELVRGSSLDREAGGAAAREGNKKVVGMEDALILCRAIGLFTRVSGSDGSVDMFELKQTLREFGKYYSQHEVCCMLEKFKLAHGSSLAQDPKLNLPQFLRLLVNLDEFAPKELPALKKLHDMSPTHIIDVQTRKIYPAAYFIRTVLMLAIIDLYTQ